MTQQMYLSTFFVRQRFAMTTNRYELYAAGPDGGPGQLYGLAEQKRFAFKEQVTFFSDDTKTRPVFGFRARRTIDLNAGYDITDEAGHPLGFFRKDFGASLRFTSRARATRAPGRNEAWALRWSGASSTSRSSRSTSTSSGPTGRLCWGSSGRPRSATSTPSTCPTSASTSGSRRRSRWHSTP
jgi:hypothetical protein